MVKLFFFFFLSTFGKKHYRTFYCVVNTLFYFSMVKLFIFLYFVEGRLRPPSALDSQRASLALGKRIENIFFSQLSVKNIIEYSIMFVMHFLKPRRGSGKGTKTPLKEGFGEPWFPDLVP